MSSKLSNSSNYSIDYEYGSIPTNPAIANQSNLSINDSEDVEVEGTRNRRWSVFEKLDRRHYCRIRSCNDCLRIINSKCLLATVMLGIFILLATIFTRTVILSTGITETNHYDFIVVGAGPSGSVITNRLVNSGAKVLLLEAGGNTQYELGGSDYFGGPISRFDIPLMWTAVTTCADNHWHGFNIPGIIVAKGLGGGGINNAMLYVRALASDITKWNLRGWDWNTLLSHYLTFEDYGNDIKENPIPYYHRQGGLLRTTRAPYVDEIAPEFISSAVQYGIKYTNDFNSPDGRIGVGYYDFNIKGGLRDSAAREFLAPIMNQDPPNTKFTLELNAIARKVILTPNILSSSYYNSQFNEPKRSSILSRQIRYEPHLTEDRSFTQHVTGVEYEQNGIIKTAYLSNTVNGAIQNKFEYGRGVILTCGAILTPKLLMNSGIGPRDVLEAAGVDVKVENPMVGKNLQDHPAVGVTFRLSPALASSYPNVYSVMSHWGQYVNNVERAKRGENVSPSEFGVLSSPGISSGAFLVSPFADNDDAPDIQLTVFPTVAEPHLIQDEWTRRTKNATSAYLLQQSKQMLITVALLDPEARYEIVLNSTDPIGSVPLVRKPPGKYHYLSEKDVKKLAWGVEQVIKISNVRPLADLVEEVLSPPADLGNYEAWVHNNHYPNSHWSGSAMMGMNPKESVLDESMKVRGVKGLYVGDASAMPVIPNGNVHSTIVVVAAQAAELILRTAVDGRP